MWIRALAWAVGVCMGFAAVSPRPTHAATHALLVGIRDYVNTDKPLNGCEADVDQMKLLLERRYDVPEANIVVLKSRHATKRNIVSALQQAATRVGAEDTYIFFFSGHGGRARDDNGDEPDGWDETLMPTDAARNPRTQIRDDELGELLDRFRTSRIVVILDSCHSGTATRSISKGSQVKCMWDSRPSGAKAAAPAKTVFTALKATQHREVLIAGCRANETSSTMSVTVPPNKRYAVSALTFFLTKAIRGPGDADRDGLVSYAEATDYAQREIQLYFQQDTTFRAAARNLAKAQADAKGVQTVTLEARNPGSPVFGMRPVRPFYGIIRNSGAGSVTFDLGAIHGVTLGSVYSVFRPGTTTFTTASAIGQVRVRQVGRSGTAAQVVSGNAQGWGGHWVAVASQAVAEPRLVVRVGVRTTAGRSVEFARAVAYILQREDWLRVTEQHDEATDVAVLCAAEVAAGNMKLRAGLQRSNGLVTDMIEDQTRPESDLTRDPAVSRTARRVLAALSRFLALRTLSMLSNPRPSFSVRLETDRGTAPRYRIGERMQIRVSASADCYVTLVDIGTSGRLSVVYPARHDHDNRVRAGQTLTFPPPGRGKFLVRGPVGADRLKAIATRQRVDLTAAVRDPGQPAHRLARDLVRALGAGTLNLSVDQWADACVTIQIVP